MRRNDLFVIGFVLLGTIAFALAQSGPNGGIVGPGGTGGGGGGGGGCKTANPTATAGPNAINGTASTCMTSDSAPAVQIATTSQPGLTEPDGTSIGINGAGQIFVIGGGGGSGTVTSVAAGCGNTTNVGAITTAGTISSINTPLVLTGANVPILSTYCGETIYLNNAGSQTPTIGEAGSTGYPIGWSVYVCNIGAGTQTLTPGGGTVAGASTLAFSGGSQTSPGCHILMSDGTSNYYIR